VVSRGTIAFIHELDIWKDSISMRTSNPALSAKTFTGFGPLAESVPAMTIQGTVNKTGLSLLVVFLAATWAWINANDRSVLSTCLLAGLVLSPVIALITVFKKSWAPITTPLYAATKGLALGAISMLAEAAYPGIAAQAVAITFGTLACLLVAYKSGAIKATENFKLGVTAATGAIALIYLATLVLRLFGVQVPYIHEGGPIGIGFSLFVVAIAAFNLVLDFDFIERGADERAPKYMEWYAAFGLLVTLVWLYLEVLKLLMKVRSRDD
jgi:uncharacterized YccA/Bax inhibitor family protein